MLLLLGMLIILSCSPVFMLAVDSEESHEKFGNVNELDCTKIAACDSESNSY